MRTLTEQANAVARGDVSPRELVDAALGRIENAQGRTNAFTHVLADDARERAGGVPDGPLRGVPVAVKELYDVAGVPTTGCCAAYNDRVGARDSAVVEALRGAGAIVVAKTNQHELATGATSAISSSGPVLNPWGPGRCAGGSSGGSGAAVASGAVAMAMGSDTGGSIRIPSSFCGVTGLKPTHGAVSLRGVMPLTPSLDTAGPLCVSARDCLLVHRVVAGFDPDDPWSADAPPVGAPESVAGLKVAVLRNFMRMLNPETRAAVEQCALTLESLGAVIDEVDGPDPDEGWQTGVTILITEFAHCYRDLWDDERVQSQPLLAAGRSISGADYVAAVQTGRKVRRDFEWALTLADVLLAPTTPYPAPLLDTQQVEVDGGTRDVHGGGPARLTIAVNVAGLPSLAFPTGMSSEGMPLSAQLIGRPWAEEVLCTVGAAYQDATDWHLREPQAT